MTLQITTNMKCGSCLARVQAKLDGFKGIKSWRADLDDPRKLLYVDLIAEADPAQVVEVIHDAGFNAEIVERDLGFSREEDSGGGKIRISTYKPLVLVVAYVFGATLLLLHASENWQLHVATTYFMGFFFLGFSFFKLLDVPKFADAFATYDIIAKKSRAYALGYPWLEFGLGIMFVTQLALLFANIATMFVMSIGLVGVVSAVRQEQAIQCACLGTVFNLPMSVVTIVENSIMLVMSGIMIGRLLLTSG